MIKNDRDRMELLYQRHAIHERALGEGDSYKYLGVLEADHVLHKELKERLKERVYKTREEVFEVQAEWRKYDKSDRTLGLCH